MKQSIVIKLKLYLCLILFHLPAIIFAQFTPPTHNEEYSHSFCNSAYYSNVNNTGNDAANGDNILEDMRVSVWDGTYPRLGWKYGNTSFKSCNRSIIHTCDVDVIPSDPDVVLYKGTSKINPPNEAWFAIVVFMSNGNAYCTIYEYDPNLDQFHLQTCTNLSTASGSFVRNAINIDMTNDYYVITWDDLVTSDIMLVEGHGSSPPTVAAKSVFSGGQTPDVAVIRDPYSLLGPNIFITFVNNLNPINGANLFVIGGTFNYGFSIVYNNSSDPVLPSTMTFWRPRIACPRVKQCDKQWSMITYTIHSISDNNIVGVTSTCFGMKSRNYTNGSSDSPGDIHWTYSYGPCVSYNIAIDGDPDVKSTPSESITIVWTIQYPMPGYASNHHNIGLFCNSDGSLRKSCSPNYLLLPNLTTADYFRSPSVSGRFFDNMFFTYLGATGIDEDILYKEVPSCSSTFRERSLEEGESGNKYFVKINNPFNSVIDITTNLPLKSKVNISIYDARGILVYHSLSAIQKSMLEIEALSQILTSGIYIIKYQSDELLLNEMSKIVKL